MNTYTVKFPGHYLTGCAVIVAHHRQEALTLLIQEMKEVGLGDEICDDALAYNMVELPNKPQAIILNTGDY